MTMRPPPSSWSRVPIVDLCAAHVDCVNRTAPIVEGPTPFKMIRTSNVRNGYIDTENVRYVTEPIYKKWTRRLVPRRDDVILTREAPLGDVGKLRSDEPIFLGQRLYHFRPDPQKLNADFLLYSLLGPDLQRQIRSFGSGSTVEHMKLENIPNLQINLPPLPLQRRIAGILSAYDDLIENSQRRVRILEMMVRALYFEWFVHFRVPGHEKLGRFRSSVGEVPEGWSVMPIGELSSYLSRGLSPSYDDNASAIVINQKCIRDQRLSLDPARRQSKAIPTEKRVQLGDVLINSTGVGTLGRVAQVYEDLGDCTVDTHVTIARPNSETDMDYFGCALLSQQDTFERLGIGATGQTELSRTSIASVELVVPPSDLQRRFGQAVRPMKVVAMNHAKRIQNLRRTRDLLLPRLTLGQIEVGAKA